MTKGSIAPRTADRPAVGLLYNPATPRLIRHCPDRVEYLAIMPDRLWYDFGAGAQGRRFHRTLGAIDEARECARGRAVAGHGIGLSLPSAIPLDEAFVEQVAAMADDFRFSWYSEHLSVFLAPKSSVPNAQAGLGLPLAYDEETFALVSDKMQRLRSTLGCPIILENGAFFTPVPEMEMTETDFLNRLYAEADCGTLLDLHNLHVNWQHGGVHPRDYLRELDPNAVVEIHLAGGDEFAGFYMDSHAGLTPDAVWEYAWEHAPRFPRLRAITFEFQETYIDDIGDASLAAELARMRDLAEACARSGVDARAR